MAEEWAPITRRSIDAKVGVCKILHEVGAKPDRTRADQWCQHSELRAISGGEGFFRPRGSSGLGLEERGRREIGGSGSGHRPTLPRSG